MAKSKKHIWDCTEISKLHHACFEISHHYFLYCQIPTSGIYQLYDTTLPVFKEADKYTLPKKKENRTAALTQLSLSFNTKQ